jgi:soluble lytic murein transglycosylase
VGRRVRCVVLCVLAAGCSALKRAPLPSAPRADDAVAMRPAATLRAIETAARQHPVLGDYALYFRARAAANAGRDREAVESVEALLAQHEDSVWAGRARLLAGQALRRRGDAVSARAWLSAARTALTEPSPHWARATLDLAELEAERGDPASALALATELRQSKTRGLAARRMRRLAERVRIAHPELPTVDHVEEAEFRLREGDTAGARAEAEVALSRDPAPDARARALWVRAQAERALGDRPAAEATCLRLASEDDPLAARGLLAVGSWRWNADDDAAALRFFHQTAARFPKSPQAAEALYAIGRIEQEAGRYDGAFEAYRRVAERYPDASLANEAAWRAGWVRYLGADFASAARWFAHLAARMPEQARPAAEYWGARALERLGRRTESVEKLTHLADFHTTSYYAGLAEERLGRPPTVAAAALPADDPPPPFPASLTGLHAERARALASVGFRRLARRELDALAADAPRQELIDAYQSVGAISASLRVAREVWRDSTNTPHRDLYPLGYWEIVRSASLRQRLDPFLVVSLIRQESLFEPEAVSSADARGLMQLMPATARELSRDDGMPVEKAALFRPDVNVDLGTTLLARLLERYDGSPAKALAAYNAGQEAVAKWERRYGQRDKDEFVELISFRETRDYVKAVLRNYRLYRRLYAPSDSATSAGNPPNAPFDMTTMTSPGRADATR